MSQTSHSFETTISHKERLNFWLSLPADYDADRSKHHPLLLFLHGAGERAGNGNTLEIVKMHGPPKRIEKANTLPFIVVSPQCPQDSWWPAHMETLMGLLDTVIKNYRVDTQRVYLTGLSMGGFGTWHIAAQYPQRFAAAVPICGALTWYVDLQQAAQRMKDLPLWVFHGALDDVVPIGESQRVVDALKAVGSKVKFTVYKNAGHDSWTKTYANPKLYEWLLQHSLADRVK